MSETLKDYAKHIRSDACFSTITEIKKAIRAKDDASALMSLGELREQIALLDHYIDTLEKKST